MITRIVFGAEPMRVTPQFNSLGAMLIPSDWMDSPARGDRRDANLPFE